MTYAPSATTSIPESARDRSRGRRHRGNPPLLFHPGARHRAEDEPLYLHRHLRRHRNRLAADGERLHGIREAPNRMILVGDGATAEEAARTIRENRNFGYALVGNVAEHDATVSQRASRAWRRKPSPTDRRAASPQAGSRPWHIARHPLLGASLSRPRDIHERIMRKVPLADLEDLFLENIEGTARFDDP